MKNTTVKQKKSRIYCNLVPEVGLEPTHPKICDFESHASTNSATPAIARYY